MHLNAAESRDIGLLLLRRAVATGHPSSVNPLENFVECLSGRRVMAEARRKSALSPHRLRLTAGVPRRVVYTSLIASWS